MIFTEHSLAHCIKLIKPKIHVLIIRKISKSQGNLFVSFSIFYWSTKFVSIDIEFYIKKKVTLVITGID